MKNKSPLTLMEQAIMLLVFALAAVLCLQAFVWADSASKEIAEQDQALIQAQSAAEVLKSCVGDMEKSADIFGGDWDGQVWTVGYDVQWQQTEENAVYVLTVTPKPEDTPYLGAATVYVSDGEEALAQLDVAWQQEVGNHD